MELHAFPPIPEGAKTGLLLFGAFYKGRNDGGHFLQAGLTSTVVDINPVLLGDMAVEYPDTWNFILGDAFDFAAMALGTYSRWDVVSVDPSAPEGERVFSMLDTWRALGTKMVVVGCRHANAVNHPPGWRIYTGRGLTCGDPWSWLVADIRP